jgi:hypothetical protein
VKWILGIKVRGADWINMAANKMPWRPVLNKVMNISVSKIF